MMLDTGKLHFEFCYVVSVINCYQFERTMYNFDSKNFMCMLLFVVVTFFFLEEFTIQNSHQFLQHWK